MQWLIDIIKEWVLAQGYLSSSFVDRGEFVSEDLSREDFIGENEWIDFDLSAIVPAEAKAILLIGKVNCAISGAGAKVRRKGCVTELNISAVFSQGSGVTVWHDAVCQVDSARIIQYKLFACPWTYFKLSVRGWWL